MGSSSSKEPSQKEKAKEAVVNLTEAIEKAIEESAKLQGPLDSEKTVISCTNQVLEICRAQAKQTSKRLVTEIQQEKLKKLLLGMERPGTSRGNPTNALREKMAADLLFLELIKAAMESGGPGKEISSSVIAHPWTRKDDLGKGAFGRVYAAVDKNGFKFAVKEVPRSGIEEKTLRDEVKLLGKLSHKNVIKFYGCAGDEKYFFMYIELMQGFIADVMKRTDSPIPNDKAVKYTRDFLQGLAYLHSQNVVHRDIKCANILLDDEGVAKLADMGISKLHDHSTMLDRNEDTAGTICWMSPEVLTGKEAGKRSDVWSAGCSVYEMVKGQPPFIKDLPPVLLKILLPKMILNFEHAALIKSDDDLDPRLQDFLLKIFVEIEQRPYVEAIAEHSWLQQRQSYSATRSRSYVTS